MGEYKKLNIKDWAVEDRPREKLLSKEQRTQTEDEPLAILMCPVTIEETAV